GGCGFAGAGQPASSVILCGSAGYSTFTLAFIQELYNLYKLHSIGSLYWTGGDWTGTPGSGAVGALQPTPTTASNGPPAVGFGCVLACSSTPPPPRATDYTLVSNPSTVTVAP